MTYCIAVADRRGDGDAVFAATRIGTIDQRHPITADLEWSSFPISDGYNRLVAKAEATVLARTESRDPPRYALMVIGVPRLGGCTQRG
jgi:uncharacterized membrane protein